MTRQSSTRHDVVVVGAGLAGLHCAAQLVDAGRDVVVLEARDRVGGRVHSHRFADGQWCERGAEFVDAAHSTVLGLVERFGLALCPVPSGRDDAVRMVDLGGRPAPYAFYGSLASDLGRWDAALAELAAGIDLDDLPGSVDAQRLDATPLSAVLDGYSGARLERALTQGDKRLADSVGAGNGLMGRGPQFFVLDGVPAKGVSPETLEAALRAQVKKVADTGVTEAELQRVKTQWVASEVYRLDSVFYQARELGSAWALGLPPDHGTQLIARLRQVTAAQVQAVAQKYFGDDALTVAILRPQPMGQTPTRRAVPGARH